MILEGYHPVLITLNYSEYPNSPLNFVVKRVSSGEAIIDPHHPPSSEYWVGTRFSIWAEGEMRLDNVPTPAGWTGCSKIHPVLGTPYYQVCLCCILLTGAFVSTFWS
jgi:hypothetical protein